MPQEITTPDRSEAYSGLLPQLRSLIEGETDLVANLANVAAALRDAFAFHWVGFYLVKDEELVLGPFQGPVACTRISKGKGVCGKAWAEGYSIVVSDVDKFPGHIVCSAHSRSEIVVPIKGLDGTVLAVLDVDSDQLDDFSNTDLVNLEQVAALLTNTFHAQ